MGTIGIPFTEEMHSMILREARRKGMPPEMLLKIWILERTKKELEPVDNCERREERNVDAVDLLSLPLRFGYVLMASATATISTLVDEIGSK